MSRLMCKHLKQEAFYVILREPLKTCANSEPQFLPLKNFTFNINNLALRDPLLGSRRHLGFAQAAILYQACRAICQITKQWGCATAMGLAAYADLGTLVAILGGGTTSCWLVKSTFQVFHGPLQSGTV
jgi:hypothetical protein